MSYRTPEARSKAVRDARDAMVASRKTILTTHVNGDGDGAGCEAAVCSWLRANGTEAWIINPTPFPDPYWFLIEHPSWVVDATSPEAEELCDGADLAVVLDTGEVPRLGRVRALIRELPTVVLDHHPLGEQPIGGISLRDPEACATGELVYDVLLAANGPFTDSAMHGIYVAILTDTGGFRFSNSTAASHRIAAEVIERGVDPEEMHTHVYGAAPLRRYRLLQQALATLEVDEGSGVAWMTIPKEALLALGATPEDLEGMVDVPRSLQGAQVGLLFRETSTGEVKVSFRSNGGVDVNELARRFGGGGHVRASGAIVPGPVERAIAEMVQAAKHAVEGIPKGARA